MGHELFSFTRKHAGPDAGFFISLSLAKLRYRWFEQVEDKRKVFGGKGIRKERQIWISRPIRPRLRFIENLIKPGCPMEAYFRI